MLIEKIVNRSETIFIYFTKGTHVKHKNIFSTHCRNKNKIIKTCICLVEHMCGNTGFWLDVFWDSRDDKKINRKKKKKNISINKVCIKSFTHPTSFALIFKCFFGVLCRCLNIIDRMFNMVFYAINHFTLHIWFFNV